MQLAQSIEDDIDYMLNPRRHLGPVARGYEMVGYQGAEVMERKEENNYKRMRIKVDEVIQCAIFFTPVEPTFQFLQDNH